jgi:hypothetical protein
MIFEEVYGLFTSTARGAPKCSAQMAHLSMEWLRGSIVLFTFAAQYASSDV